MGKNIYIKLMKFIVIAALLGAFSADARHHRHHHAPHKLNQVS